MAKYRYVKTGEEFKNEGEAYGFFCNSIDDCESCPLDKYADYGDECDRDLIKMYYQECGFELIDSTLKSRLAEILGVEEDQEWITTNEEGKIFRIHNGARQWKFKEIPSCSWNVCWMEEELAELINNPNLIQPVPTIPEWTEREIEIARAWKTLNPDMKQFEITTDSSNAPEEFEIDGVMLSNLNNDCPNFTAQDFLEIKVCDILGDEV